MTAAPVAAGRRTARGQPVALVHHWLVTRRGGEKCLDALSQLLPGATLFTLVHEPRRCPAPSEVARVVTSTLFRWPGARTLFRLGAPWLHHAFRRLDLAGFPFVVSSDAATAKAVAKDRGALHVCYCYSPVRWAFDLRESYLSQAVPAPLRPLARWATGRVAAADREAAQHVDHFVTVSAHVADRIERAYGRTAVVVPPPVDTHFFTPGPSEPPPALARLLAQAPWAPEQRPYLLLGQAVPYKRFDLAVRACRILDRPLIVAGTGPQFKALRKLAGARTLFVSQPDDLSVRALYRQARALLFPGEEDFGLVPVEAMACGTPVVALGRGGATETLLDGLTGVLYDDPAQARAQAGDSTALVAGIRRFESLESGLVPARMVERAGTFSLESHLRSMGAALAAAGIPVTPVAAGLG